MATQALAQMLGQTRWGTQETPLDVLVVDLPPGTGDVQLTLVQRTKLDGAVVVSTPQEVALADARRAVRMFGKLPDPVPILGIVENMAYFADSSGAEVPIFGRGGAKAEAERLGVAFLGEVPIELAIREGGDAGRPIVAADAASRGAKAFAEIARQVREKLKL
jgi:ATP-binding protein involved in chromosome partitioning